MTVQFRNLVFEGGGVRGIAYTGAMRALEARGILDDIVRVGGTSAGAINALITSLRYTIDEQESILRSTDFSKFMDNSAGFVRDLWRLIRLFGWNPGDHFEEWIGDLIREKMGRADATFADLEGKKCIPLYVIGTNLSTGYAEVFSPEHTPGMPLTEALRISMSIPLFFAAKRYGPRNDVYVDGGVQLNYPIKLFDREVYIEEADRVKAALPADYYKEENKRLANKILRRGPYVYNRQTLGLRLDSKEEIGLFRYDEPLKGRPIRNLVDYARVLVTALMQAEENQHLHSDDWHRTIYICTPDVKSTDFNLSETVKQDLVKQGREGVKTYFDWFDSKTRPDVPVNRI